MFLVSCSSSVRFSSTAKEYEEERISTRKIAISHTKNSTDNTAITIDKSTLSKKQARLLEAAETWLGVPYRFGGLDRNGIDCSGLMYSVFSSIGEVLPRTSQEQFMIGEEVEFENMAVGDLLFFNTTANGVSHVGMFAGGSEFIHASTSRGVVRESINEPYFVRRYVSSKRIISENKAAK